MYDMLQHGKLFKWYKAECRNCECKFMYQLLDTHIPRGGTLEDDKVVTCPECMSEIVHDEETHVPDYVPKHSTTIVISDSSSSSTRNAGGKNIIEYGHYHKY